MAYMSEEQPLDPGAEYDEAEQVEHGDVVAYLPDTERHSEIVVGTPDTGVVTGIDDDGYATIMWDTGPVAERVPKFCDALRETHDIRIIGFAYEELDASQRADRLSERA